MHELLDVTGGLDRRSFMAKDSFQRSFSSVLARGSIGCRLLLGAIHQLDSLYFGASFLINVTGYIVR